MVELQARLQVHFTKYVRLYFVIAATFVFGLCAHAYRFFNLDFSHDSLMVFQDDREIQIGLGRFLQPLYRILRGDLGAPFLLGLLSLVWLALANYIVISLLEIRSIKHIALLCGILSTNAVLTFSFATYLPWADVYMLAYLLAALAAWLAVRFSWGFLSAWVPLTLSLALYQSYFNVTVILLMIAFVKNVLDGFGPKKLLSCIARYLGALLGGLAAYYIVLRLVLSAAGIALLENENGMAWLWNYRVDTLLEIVAATWKYPLRYMLHPETYQPRAAALVNVAVGLAAAAALVRTALAKKLAKIPAVLLGLCILVMPFGINAVFFITKGNQHSLMIFSFFLLYAFAFMLWEYHDGLPPAELPEKLLTAVRRTRPLFTALLSGLLLLIVLFNVVFANQVYLKKALEYEATMSFLIKLTYSIEQTEGYVPGETPVILVGSFETSSLFAERKGFEKLTGVGLDRESTATYLGTFKHFFNSFLSYRINLINTGAARDYAAWPEVRAMPVYPAKGSSRIVNGVLVVKLQDVYVDSDSE